MSGQSFSVKVHQINQYQSYPKNNLTSKDARRVGEICGPAEAILRSSSSISEARSATPILISTPINAFDKNGSIRFLDNETRARRTPFMCAISDNVKLRASSHLRSLTNESLRVSTNKVTKQCINGGLKAKYIDANLKLEQIECSFTGKDEGTRDIDEHVEVIIKIHQDDEERGKIPDQRHPFQAWTQVSYK